jgi:sugar O-acyltransferase (sialic acid O-acetyltransferase NeuD family)
MKDLVIIGAGGFGREVADTVRSINQVKETYHLLGFIDDADHLKNRTINDMVVLGNRTDLKALGSNGNICAAIAIANAQMKKEITEDLDGFVTWDNIIHPTAQVSDYCDMGTGNILQAFSIVGPNARVGNHCMINARSGMGHDARMDDYVSVMSLCDITGGVHLKEGVYLALGVGIIPGITIGEYAYVCAGSIVFKDVEARATMIGNPAKRIK